MTTIATDGKSMAADGLTTSNGVIFGTNAVKVHRLKDGRIVGIAGGANYGKPFLAWLAGELEEMPEIGENFEALVLRPDGTCQSYDHMGRTLDEELPTASGSGREVALGALGFGASPEEAVKVACERCTESGGTITVLHIEPPLRAVA